MHGNVSVIFLYDCETDVSEEYIDEYDIFECYYDLY